MSLINKMLQDLESRKRNSSDTDPQESAYDGLRSVQTAAPRTAPRALALVLLLTVIVGFGVFAWRQWGEGVVAGRAPPVTAAPVTTVLQTSPPPVAAANVSPANEEIIPAPLNAAPAAPETQATAIPPPLPGQNTEPPKNNNINNEKAANSLKSGYWTVADGETLYRVATATNLNASDLATWNSIGADHRVIAGQKLRLTPPGPVAAVSRAVLPAAVVKPKLPQAKATASKAPAPSTIAMEDEENTDSGQVDKKFKPQSREQHAESGYRNAVNMLQQGRADDAMYRLRTALTADPAHIQARELLAGLELQNGRWRQAQQVLEQGLETNPKYFSFAQLLARVYVEHGAEPKALALLESNRPQGSGNAEFMSFLATLYQRAGRHADAVAAYTDAVKLNPREGRTWLGMAISLEANADWKSAEEAYQHAIDSGMLDAKLMQYAKQHQAAVKKKL